MQYPPEFLNSLNPSGLPSHKLKIKLGSPIMLMRNLQTSKGHTNGTKYIVIGLHGRIIEAEIATEAFAGNRLFIPRIPLKPTEATFPFHFTRRQFPIR